jgi:glycosyltransferase involved in cell wall biosynthesis
MRVGHNPARFVEKIAQPAEITVTVVNCLPFLSGYYEQSLDVLKVVVESLNATREASHPYDVMIFDNHSCAEVRAYLKEASDQGKIQYLVFSDVNIGKIGAWNYMFGAAQGKYIVFSDGDIEFRPGWLSASLELFENFPNVGMVTARPLPTSKEFSSATYDWAIKEKVLEEGPFLDREVIAEHARSLGWKPTTAGGSHKPPRQMSRVTFNGKVAYIGAAHFQFMARRDLLHKMVPLHSDQPMRGERALDIAVNDMKLLRLTTIEPLVMHLGNRLPSPVSFTTKKKKSPFLRLLWLPGIRHILLWIHNQIFRVYFFNVE